MEFRKIGKEKIPVLGIGTWGMGGWISKEYSNDNECIKSIRTAIKLGMTHIDTAEVYGMGHAEGIVGKAIKGIPRKKLFITTKVYMNHLRYNDVIISAKKSMKRMGIKYIDLYLIHWPNPNIPLKETIKAMDYLVDKKLVRFIGVSNFSVKLLKEAQSYTKNKIIANQVEYSLLKRDPDRGLLKYCQQNGIILTAYQPLAGGKLARKGFKVLDELSRKYNKTQSQIAINWLISKENVIAIPKASNPSHVMENSGAIGWKLKKEDSRMLEKYFWKFWFSSNFFGIPLRTAKHAIARIIPESRMEGFEAFYSNVLGKIKKLEKMILTGRHNHL